MLQSLVVVLESGYAPLQLLVRVRRHLYLDCLEADAKVLQLVVVFFEFLLPALTCELRSVRRDEGRGDNGTYRWAIRLCRKMMRWAARSARSIKRPWICCGGHISKVAGFSFRNDSSGNIVNGLGRMRSLSGLPRTPPAAL